MTPWPLSAPSGKLHCDHDAVTFRSDGGTTYAVNGLAVGQEAKHGWHDVAEIWLDDTSSPGLKVNMGGLIAVGLALCD